MRAQRGLDNWQKDSNSLSHLAIKSAPVTFRFVFYSQDGTPESDHQSHTVSWNCDASCVSLTHILSSTPYYIWKCHPFFVCLSYLASVEI